MWLDKPQSTKQKIFIVAKSAVIMVLSTIVINVIVGNTAQFNSFADFIFHNGYGLTFGLVFWLGNWSIGRLTGQKLDWKNKPSQSNILSLISLISFGITASILIPYFFLKHIFKVAPNELIGLTVIHAFMALAIDMILTAIFYSRYLVYYWGQSIKNEEALKHENLLAKYEALKNQVNPHFLFNTLNTLTGLVEQKPEEAPLFIKKLSQIYRYVLDQQTKELVPFENELAFTYDFIYLSKIRTGDGLIVNNNVNSNQFYIVPLGLQMLVENAIKHNIASDDSPLEINIALNENYLIIKNNIQVKRSLEQNSNIGLENLTQRYAYLTSVPVKIKNENAIFEVHIPIIKNIEE